MPSSFMASSEASGSRMPPELLAQKSQKWIQMQKKRYGEKRKGGYVDMGKQVRLFFRSFMSSTYIVCRIYLPNMSVKLSRTMAT
jgi:hypothetical protein